MKSLRIIIMSFTLLFCWQAQADPAPSNTDAQHPIKKLVNHLLAKPLTTSSKSLVLRRTEKENKTLANAFGINFYNPTYILPFYFTATPDQRVYKNNTPDNLSVRHTEMQYQLSFKVPLWKDIFNYRSSLFLAYTQKSFWQAYNKMAFFRETDYEPEVFLANEFNFHLPNNWTWNFFNIGMVHQSNGFGGTLERSWNRIYLEGIYSNNNWMISLKPWVILHDATFLTHNPNMGRYLGHERILVACKFYHQVLALETRNLVEYGGHRAGVQLTWSFPLTPYLNGYLVGFTGYGQSLIEYNHRTNGVGLGVALSNWI